jgi:hypothetical protein
MATQRQPPRFPDLRAISATAAAFTILTADLPDRREAELLRVVPQPSEDHIFEMADSLVARTSQNTNLLDPDYNVPDWARFQMGQLLCIKEKYFDSYRGECRLKGALSHSELPENREYLSQLADQLQNASEDISQNLLRSLGIQIEYPQAGSSVVVWTPNKMTSCDKDIALMERDLDRATERVLLAVADRSTHTPATWVVSNASDASGILGHMARSLRAACETDKKNNAR